MLRTNRGSRADFSSDCLVQRIRLNHPKRPAVGAWLGSFNETAALLLLLHPNLCCATRLVFQS